MNNGIKLKTVKNNFNNIKKDGVDYDKFILTISRANDAYYLCNHFINAYFLYCFKTNTELPIFNKSFFGIAFKALSKKSCGPICKGINAINLEKLNKFF